MERRASGLGTSGSHLCFLQMMWFCGLQRTLERFTVKCEAAGMKVGSSKSEAVVFNGKKMEYSLQVGDESCLRRRCLLPRVAGLSLRDGVRSLAIWRELGVESFPLHIKRSQLRWFGHLGRMPPGCLPLEVFQACPTGRIPWGRPRTRWRDYISFLAWEHLKISRRSWRESLGKGMSFRTNLE